MEKKLEIEDLRNTGGLGEQRAEQVGDDRSSRLHSTAQMNVRSSVMALSPLELSIGKNRQ